MKLLQERILKEGTNLGNGILKVDGFVNHQVDPMLMDTCGKEFARLFKSLGATKVLTAEISGIAPAVTTALPASISPSPCLIRCCSPWLPRTPRDAQLS